MPASLRLPAFLLTWALPGLLLACARARPVAAARGYQQAVRAADAEIQACIGAAERTRSPLYRYRKPAWRQLHPAANAPVYVIESVSLHSSDVYGVVWSGADTLSYHAAAGNVSYRREGSFPASLKAALVQWKTGPCPRYKAPATIHQDLYVLQVYWPDGRYQLCCRSF